MDVPYRGSRITFRRLNLGYLSRSSLYLTQNRSFNAAMLLHADLRSFLDSGHSFGGDLGMRTWKTAKPLGAEHQRE
jgi:hypothetical protein